MSKKGIKVISISVLVLLIIGAIVGVIGYFSDGFKKWDKFIPNNKQTEIQSVGGSVLNPILSNGVTFACERLTAPVNADSAYTLTATINPDVFDNKTIVWSARFNNLASSWANGKEISDYLTLDKATTNSGESVSLICHKDFGEQIIVTASTEADSSKKALCTVDYKKRIKDISYTFKYDNNDIQNVTPDEDGVYRIDYTNENKNYTIVPVPVYSNYTIDIIYSSIVSGKFISTFGFGQDVNFDNITLAGGAYTYVEPDVSEENTLNFLDMVKSLDKYNKLTTGLKLDPLFTNYLFVSDTEKNHPKVVLAYNGILNLRNLFKNNCSEEEYNNALSSLKNAINNYIPESYYSFMNVDVNSMEELFLKAYACNKAEKGIIEYSIIFSSGEFVKEFNFSLGFTKDSLQSFASIDLDTGEIII
jgi:hypothetical protein